MMSNPATQKRVKRESRIGGARFSNEGDTANHPPSGPIASPSPTPKWASGV